MADIDRIIAEMGPALARVAAAYERDPALREDLLQDILIAISRSLPRLREEAQLRPFIFRIAHNKGVDHVARHAGEPQTQETSEDLARPDGSPEEHVIIRQRAERLQTAVRKLELPYRQVITLLLEDLTYAEIAETLGISISNVGVRINRAKALLRSLLDHG
ncbi:MAG TPA: sigma-70 family RNA polymerase sigma factor [Steroidobacteraceae bacterium]|nr:sigma-70 family RNA polymerase sigma factor [Steroidobacteraceae bacterium]